MAYHNTQEIRGRAKRYSSYKISRSQGTTSTFHKNKPPYKESKPKTTLSNKDTNIHIERERLKLMMESESVTSSQGRVGRRACQCWGGGRNINERAREKGKKEMTQKCERENSLSIRYPIGVYIVHQM